MNGGNSASAGTHDHCTHSPSTKATHHAVNLKETAPFLSSLNENKVHTSLATEEGYVATEDQQAGPACTAPPSRSRRRSPAPSLFRSPARAYLSVRQLLEEVEHQQGRDNASHAMAEIKLDFLSYPDPRRFDHNTTSTEEAEAISNPDTRLDNDAFATTSAAGKVKEEVEATAERASSMRALQRIHWLAQWTQNVLEAYPFVDDSDAETLRSDASPVDSLALTLRAFSQDGSKFRVLSASGFNSGGEDAEKPRYAPLNAAQQQHSSSDENYSQRPNSDATEADDADEFKMVPTRAGDYLEAATERNFEDLAEVTTPKDLQAIKSTLPVLISSEVAAPHTMSIDTKEKLRDAALEVDAVEARKHLSPPEKDAHSHDDGTDNNVGKCTRSINSAKNKNDDDEIPTAEKSEARIKNYGASLPIKDSAGESPLVERKLSYISDHDLRERSTDTERHTAAKHALQADARSGAGLLNFIALPDEKLDTALPKFEAAERVILPLEKETTVKDEKAKEGNTDHTGEASIHENAATTCDTAAATTRGATATMSTSNLMLQAPLPPPPPITPRGRPPLCRDAGSLHVIPASALQQRAALHQQGCRCAHCGVVLQLPRLGLRARCRLVWGKMIHVVPCAAPRRLCCGCYGDREGLTESDGSGEDERRSSRDVSVTSQRSSSPAAAAQRQLNEKNYKYHHPYHIDDSSSHVMNNRGHRHFFQQKRPAEREGEGDNSDGGGSVDQSRRRVNTTTDDESTDEDNEGSEREGLLTRHRRTHVVSGRTREGRSGEVRRQHTTPPPPQQREPSLLSSPSPQSVARRLRLNSSLSNLPATAAAASAKQRRAGQHLSRGAPRRAATAAAHSLATASSLNTNAHLHDVLPSASASSLRVVQPSNAIPGALYCVYEGVYLCNTCFHADSRSSAVEARRNAERFVAAEAWQPRPSDLQSCHGFSNRCGPCPARCPPPHGDDGYNRLHGHSETPRGERANREDGAADSSPFSVSSAPSPVRTAVAQVTDRMRQWWMARNVVEDTSVAHAAPYADSPSPHDEAGRTDDANAGRESLYVSGESQNALRHGGDAIAAPSCVKMLIPAHVLLEWDFTRYPVSTRAASMLSRFSGTDSRCRGDGDGATNKGAPPTRAADAGNTQNDQQGTALPVPSTTAAGITSRTRHSSRSATAAAAAPLPVLYDLSALNATLYTRVPALVAAWRLRKRMCLLHAELWWCPRYRNEVWGADRQESGFTIETVKALAVKDTSLDRREKDCAAPSERKGGDAESKEQPAAPPVSSSVSTNVNSTSSAAAAPPPPLPRCAAARRYLVERAEGWSLMDLYRLTTTTDTATTAITQPAGTAPNSSSRLSNHVDSASAAAPSTSSMPTATAAAATTSVTDLARCNTCRALRQDAPLLLVELQTLNAVLEEHKNSCPYCRMRCRGALDRE